jgi:hypothetical protein
MKWQTVLAGAVASVFITVAASAATSTVASAEVRISGDPGGEVAAYLHRFQAIRASGQHIVIDGPCLSACTLLTGIIPRDRVCITQRAVLGFHAASYYDDATRSLVPTARGSRVVMRLYPPAIRRWINAHGGLTPHLIALRGRQLAALYHTCR